MPRIRAVLATNLKRCSGDDPLFFVAFRNTRGKSMRIGPHFTMLTLLTLLVAPVTQIFAQGMRPQSPAGHPAGPRQALFLSDDGGGSGFGVRQTPYMDAYGNPVVVPAGFAQPCGFGHAPSPGMEACPNCPPGFTGPMPMGAGGTDPPIGYQLMEDVGIQGDLVDQRGPHYFDVRAEAVYLKRDDAFGSGNVNFTSQRITPENNQIVLSSDQLDYDWETGFRILGRYDVGPLSVLEFGYMGIYDFEADASVTVPPISPNAPFTGNLFSLFSEFATNPAAVAVPGGPMPQTERSITHSLHMDSDLQTAELTYRRYWVGFLPRVSGTILAGFRYTRLTESLLFSTSGEEELASFTDTENDLYGFQTGGDVWVGLCQGLRIGAEGKVGLFNNNYNVDNFVGSTGGGPSFTEHYEDNIPALVSDASVDLVADILPSWSIRAGYEVLFMNSVALAGNNFNTGSPYNTGPVDNGFGPPRLPFVSDQGNVFYHGGHVGLEYIW